MRSKGAKAGAELPSQTNNMSDGGGNKKGGGGGGKKNRFKFGKGGGNKKENGIVPRDETSASQPDVVGGLELTNQKPVTAADQGGYTLRNSDIINGRTIAGDALGSNGDDHHLLKGEQPVCTCPHPPDDINEVDSLVPRNESTGPALSNPSYRRNGSSPDSGNKVSVVAVIEGQQHLPPLPSSSPPPLENSNNTCSSNGSNSSTSSASICSVRPKMPAADASAVTSILHTSPQGALSSRGTKSPSSQSLVSIASSTIAMDASQDSPFSRIGSDRPKQTLGDIILQIEQRAKVLMQIDDFTKPEPFVDLQFLAHQSRYNSDIHIKRRLIAKLVDSNVLDIFLRVFQSVRTVDYLGDTVNEESNNLGANRPRSKSASEDILPRALGTSGGVESASTCALVVPSSSDNNNTDDVSESSHAGDTKSLADDFSESAQPNGKNGANNNNNLPVPLRNLRAAITLMLNTTDKSPILCEECIKKNIIQLLLEELNDVRLQASELKDQQRLYLVKGYLGILNNIVCFFNDARDIYREAGAIKTLQPYLKSSLLLVKTKTIMLLSYIINESENDVINASDKNIGFAIKMLEATMEKENHYSKKFGFWAIEVAAGLNRLGCFETNKERIVSRGILPLYHQLIMRPCSEDEQLMAAQGLWTLAYSEAARCTIKEDTNVLEALHVLQRSATREEIKRATTGALWVIEGRGSGVGAVPKSPRLPAGAGHLYLSFHWTCKQFVVRLRDKLRSFGYKVFVDTENTGTCGLPLDTVFEALEKTCVMIVCMTQRYKDSPSCRNELEQAVRLRRDLVPLRLQSRYSPDGWLSDIISTRLTLDFSREESLDNVTASLVRELGPRGRSKSALAAAAAAASVGLGDQQRGASRSPSTQSVASAHSHGTVTTAMVPIVPGDGNRASTAVYWTEEEVTHWLMENGLTTAIDKFQAINGELLFEMRKMYQVAPESFYTMLRNELNFDWITQLRFTRALDQL